MLQRPLFSAAIAAALLSFSISATPSPALAKLHALAAAKTPVASAKLAAPQLFVRGSSTLYNPDGIVITKRYVFVVWQGQSDHLPGPSTIVKYDHSGNTLGSVQLNGRCDGLRLNPYTNQIWALVNNDGLNGKPKRQPYLATIDPHSLAAKLYAFPAAQPHGGGYDDMAFINGLAFLSASNPTLNAGINDKPIVVRADLNATGKVAITPVLYGNAYGWDATAAKYGKYNFTDPDSLAVDSSGDLVVVGDNDQEIIVVQYPGAAKQKTVRYGYATQFDDVAWTSGSSGTLWIADGAQNAIYTVSATFPYGTIFSETGSGNPIQSFIGTINSDATLTPLLTQNNGVFDPGSLEFVPSSGPSDNI